MAEVGWVWYKAFCDTLKDKRDWLKVPRAI